MNDDIRSALMMTMLFNIVDKSLMRDIKARKIELDILKDYDIIRLTDNEDAELEYMLAVADLNEPDPAEIGRKYHEEQESKLGQLIVGGTSDPTEKNNWYKQFYKDTLQSDGFISFPNTWKIKSLPQPQYFIAHDPYADNSSSYVANAKEFGWYPKLKGAEGLEESPFNQKLNQFMKTKAKEYVERNKV